MNQVVVQINLFMHEKSGHTQKLDLHFCDDEFRMGWWDGSNEYSHLSGKPSFMDWCNGII